MANPSPPVSQLMVSQTTELELELTQIYPPQRMLRPLDPSRVAELAQSIDQLGLLQPILVRKCPQGYEVIFGHHRVHACRRLHKRTIRACVANLTDDEAFLVRVAENLLRNNYVDPIEEARGYKALIDKSWTIHRIAERLGKSDGYVCDRLGILDRLDGSVLLKVKQGRHITPSHAEILSRIRNLTVQRELAEFIETKRLSVRALEDIVNCTLPPRKVRVEETEDSCVAVPIAFLNAAHISPGECAQLYMRGRKLILENSNRGKGIHTCESRSKETT